MERNVLLRKEGAIMGVYLGILMIVLTILPLYYFASTTSFWAVIIGPAITGLLFPLVVAVVLTFQLRKRIGGYWNFREATTSIFTMMLVATLISSVGGLLFEKVIDPQMKERYMRNIQNNTITYLERMGTDNDDIDEQIEKIDEQIENASKESTVGTALKGLVISIIVAFVISLIFGAIFKKERPVFDQPDEEQETDNLD